MIMSDKELLKKWKEERERRAKEIKESTHKWVVAQEEIISLQNKLNEVEEK